LRPGMVPCIAEAWCWSWAGLILASATVALTMRLINARNGSAVRAEQCPPGRKKAASYEQPMRWSFRPSQGIYHGDVVQPVSHENDFMKVTAVFIHRPTDCPATIAQGEYPWSEHFHGRKRFWEFRLQIQYRRLPAAPQSQYFGLELSQPTTAPSAIKSAVRSAILGMLRKGCGDIFYVSVGDIPDGSVGEAEQSTVAIPITASDQFHVCPKGDLPPDIAEPLGLAGKGMLRANGRAAYTKALTAKLENLSCDEVYTFGIWGIAQFIDVAQWQMRGAGTSMEITSILGGRRIPINGAFYELLPGQTPGESRHLDSRKNYWFQGALWSVLQPPNADSLPVVPGASCKPKREERLQRASSWHSRAHKMLWSVSDFYVGGCCGKR